MLRPPRRVRPPPRPARAPRARSRAAARARAAPRARGHDAFVLSMLRKPSTRPNERHVQKWFLGPRLGLPMIRGRQKCPARGSEPQSTPAAPNRPPASAQCRTCKGPCTLAGGSPRARATCRACLASPDASRRALSGLGRTISPRDRRREREAQTCAIAFVGSIHHAGACKLTHGIAWCEKVTVLVRRIGTGQLGRGGVTVLAHWDGTGHRAAT